MRMPSRLFLTVIAIVMLLGFGSETKSVYAQNGFGSFSGQFVLDGIIPEPKILVKKNQNVKNPNVCAVANLLDESLVVDKKTKGIKNIFIYIRKVDKIHPALKVTPKNKLEIVFDQQACQFSPHAMFVRTDQTVLVKSNDACSHNTHTYPLKNQAENFIIPNINRAGVPLKHPVAEILPIKVSCDIHPWMKAWWLILDHPYAAVTSKDGKFKIENLPEGQYDFIVWHEQTGYIGSKKGHYPSGVATKKGFKVTVQPRKNTKFKAFLVPTEEFEDI
jgi:hypothetical protein